jgi:hypothetical protein
MNVLLASIGGNHLLALDDEQMEGLVDDIIAEIGKRPNDQFTEGDFKRFIYSYSNILDCFGFDVESFLNERSI